MSLHGTKKTREKHREPFRQAWTSSHRLGSLCFIFFLFPQQACESLWKAPCFLKVANDTCISFCQGKRVAVFIYPESSRPQSPALSPPAPPPQPGAGARRPCRGESRQVPGERSTRGALLPRRDAARASARGLACSDPSVSYVLSESRQPGPSRKE